MSTAVTYQRAASVLLPGEGAPTGGAATRGWIVPAVESTLLQSWVTWSPCGCHAGQGGAATGDPCALCVGVGERPRVWGTLHLAHPVDGVAYCVLDDAVD